MKWNSQNLPENVYVSFALSLLWIIRSDLILNRWTSIDTLKCQSHFRGYSRNVTIFLKILNKSINLHIAIRLHDEMALRSKELKSHQSQFSAQNAIKLTPTNAINSILHLVSSQPLKHSIFRTAPSRWLSYRFHHNSMLLMVCNHRENNSIWNGI